MGKGAFEICAASCVGVGVGLKSKLTISVTGCFKKYNAFCCTYFVGGCMLRVDFCY